MVEVEVEVLFGAGAAGRTATSNWQNIAGGEQIINLDRPATQRAMDTH